MLSAPQPEISVLFMMKMNMSSIIANTSIIVKYFLHCNNAVELLLFCRKIGYNHSVEQQ